MKVVEKFVSINGESRRAGELAVFIRFKHCNLHCCYCDTKWKAIDMYHIEGWENIVVGEEVSWTIN